MAILLEGWPVCFGARAGVNPDRPMWSNLAPFLWMFPLRESNWVFPLRESNPALLSGPLEL
ncbi:MAG: hypothetical protein ACUVUP_06680 [Thermaceae bacterium]